MKDTKNRLPFHFYAVCFLGWTTAPTSKKALAKLQDAFLDQMPASLEQVPYWLAIVHLPQDATYSISQFKPQAPCEWLEEGNLREWDRTEWELSPAWNAS